MTDSLIFSGAWVLQHSSIAVQVVGAQGLFFLKGYFKHIAVNKNWELQFFERYESLQHLKSHCEFFSSFSPQCFAFWFRKDDRNTGDAHFITEIKKRRYNNTCPWRGTQIIQGASGKFTKHRKNPQSL